MTIGTIRAACAGLGALVACSQANAEAFATATHPPATDSEAAIADVEFQLAPTPKTAATNSISFVLPRVAPAAPALNLTRSRDGSLSGTSVDGRIKLRLNSVSGAAMFDPGRHVVAGLLSRSVSWRQEADLTLSTPLGAGNSLSVSAGTLNLRSPSLFGAGTSRGLGEPTRWMENQVVDLGVKLDLFDEMLSYSGGLSWSDYRLVRATRFTAPDDPLLLAAPRAEPGTAYWHRIDAKLPLGDGASAFVEFGRQSEDYRSMRRRSLSPLLFDGRTFAAGGKVQSGLLNLSVSHSAVTASYGDVVETVAKVDFNGIRIGHTVRRSTYDLPIGDGDRFRSDSQTRSTSLRLSPARLISTYSDNPWLPDTLTIRSAQTVGGQDGRRMNRDSLGLSLEWTGDQSTTQAGLTRVLRRQISLLDRSAPSIEYAFDLNYSRTLGPIEVSAYGSVSLDRSAQGGTGMYGGGLSVSTSGARLPKVSLSVDYDRFDQRDRFDPMFEESGLSLAVSADLTRSLRRLDLPKAAYLKLKGYGDWRRERIGPLSAEQEVEPGIMLMFGTPF